MKFRPLTIHDLDWLKKQTCPFCKTLGRLYMGMHPKERLRCLECGKVFTIKGRPVKKKKKKGKHDVRV